MTERGWYRDPTGQHELRWFDGETWTDDGRGLPDVPKQAEVEDPQSADPVTVTSPVVLSAPRSPEIPAAGEQVPGGIADPVPPLPAGAGPVFDATVAQTLEDVEQEPPEAVFVIGVGLVAVVWSQVLVSTVLDDVYRSDWLELFAALFVAGCGVAAATLWPSGRQRLVVAVPAAALGAYAAVAALPDEWGPAVIGVAVGVAVGASAWSVGLGAATAGMALLVGQTIGWWRWEALVPAEVTDVNSEPLHLLLALAGPFLIGAVPASGMVLARRGGTGATVDGAGAWASPEPQLAVPVPPAVVAASADVVMSFVVRELVGAGALVTTQSLHGVTGHVVTKKRPSTLVAILLWFVCIIPMVIYLVNGSKEVQEPFSLTLAPDAEGTRIDVAGVGRGMAAARWVTGQAQLAWPPPSPQAPGPHSS